MNDLELSELQTGLVELVRGERKNVLQQARAATIYMPVLEALLVKTEALPAGVLKLPRVELLKGADLRRDNLARASFFLAQAVLAHPDSPPELEAAAALCVERFVPSLAITRDTYAENARKAAVHAGELTTHQATLARVPTPDGKTLADWMAAFVEAGAEVGRIHQGRSDELAVAGNREGAGPLRSEILGALGELRAVVQREVASNPELPRTLEAQIFGYFDELQRLAAQRKASAAPGAAPVVPPAPVNPPS